MWLSGILKLEVAYSTEEKNKEEWKKQNRKKNKNKSEKKDIYINISGDEEVHVRLCINNWPIVLFNLFS